MSDIRPDISPHIETLIDSFVPSHIRSGYPDLIEFVRAYLQFLETQHQSSYFQNTVPEQRFLDTQQEQFLKRIEKEIGLFVPREYEADPKIFYNKISDLWRSKGSSEAIETFFRIFFNEPVQISYPNERILIPSNSNWFQESFITLDSQGGFEVSMESIEIYRFFRNIESFVDVSRFEVIDSNTFRVYSEKDPFENVDIDDEFIIRDKNTGDFVCVGRVVESPTNIRIRNGGRDWRLGQIIRFPGTIKDTLIRVDEIDDNGSIERLSIVEYGYEHASSPTFIVSPYPVRPSGGELDIITEQLPNGAIAFTLDITSDSVGISDSAEGYQAGDYFLEDYADPLYTGTRAFFTITTNDNNNNNQQGDTDDIYTSDVVDVTLEEWLLSRATISMEFAPSSKLEGEWKDLTSIISNDFTRIQDSFYYQTFSYEINSEIYPDEYRYLVPEFHVSGHERFFNYDQAVTFDTFVVDVSFTLPFFEIDFVDSILSEDPRVKKVTKRLVDAAEVFERIQSNLKKPFFDSVGTSDEQTITPTKVVNDSVDSSEDLLGREFEKNLKGDYFGEGYTESDDIYTVTLTRTNVQDFNYSDVVKYLSETLDYFAEDYTSELYTAGAPDIAIKSFDKNLNDSLNTSAEILYNQLIKQINDTVSVTENITDKTNEKNISSDYFFEYYNDTFDYDITEDFVNMDDSADISLNGSLVTTT